MGRLIVCIASSQESEKNDTTSSEKLIEYTLAGICER